MAPSLVSLDWLVPFLDDVSCPLSQQLSHAQIRPDRQTIYCGGRCLMGAIQQGRGRKVQMLLQLLEQDLSLE